MIESRVVSISGRSGYERRTKLSKTRASIAESHFSAPFILSNKLSIANLVLASLSNIPSRSERTCQNWERALPRARITSGMKNTQFVKLLDRPCLPLSNFFIQQKNSTFQQLPGEKRIEEAGGRLRKSSQLFCAPFEFQFSKSSFALPFFLRHVYRHRLSELCI